MVAKWRGKQPRKANRESWLAGRDREGEEAEEQPLSRIDQIPFD
jgi:hypothetical protein